MVIHCILVNASFDSCSYVTYTTYCCRHHHHMVGYDEALFQDALNNLVDKVDGANNEWEETTLQIQADHKRKIVSFGYTPLEF